MKKKNTVDLKQVNLLTDICKLAHLVNMETNHKVELPMGLPSKKYCQFYIKLDSVQLGEKYIYSEDVGPVFLKEKEANNLLMAIKQKLIKCLKENPKYRYGGWK